MRSILAGAVAVALAAMMPAGALASTPPPLPSGIADAAEWYVVIDGQTIGPLTDAGIERRIADGSLTDDTLVWREDLAGWVKAGECAGIQAVKIEARLAGRLPSTPLDQKFGRLVLRLLDSPLNPAPTPANQAAMAEISAKLAGTRWQVEMADKQSMLELTLLVGGRMALATRKSPDAQPIEDSGMWSVFDAAPDGSFTLVLIGVGITASGDLGVAQSNPASLHLTLTAEGKMSGEFVAPDGKTAVTLTRL